MYIDYTKLWKLLVDKKPKKKDLASFTWVSSLTMSKLSVNRNVNTEVLVRICSALQCDISDIAEIARMEDNH